MLNFVQNLTSQFEISPTMTQFAIVTFSDNSTISTFLNEYSDGSRLRSFISTLKNVNGGTNIGSALLTMRRYIYDPAKGDRPDAVDIGILITDGKDTVNPGVVGQEADLAKEKGITMITLAITNEPNEQELERIASKPADEHMFRVQNFAALSSSLSSIVSKACKPEDVTGRSLFKKTKIYISCLRWTGKKICGTGYMTFFL